MLFTRRSLKSFLALSLAFAGIACATPSEVQAQGPCHYGSGYYTPSYAPGWGSGYPAPVYHAPSVHADYRYHADSYHWTPYRGLHTHGHYDAVPHYTPGHYDTVHGGYFQGNPWYHH